MKTLYLYLADEYLGELAVDHLRNHGFLLTPKGWRLAPMFDVNPNPDGGEHALDMGDLIADAGYYRLTKTEADREYARMKEVVGETSKE